MPKRSGIPRRTLISRPHLPTALLTSSAIYTELLAGLLEKTKKDRLQGLWAESGQLVGNMLNISHFGLIFEQSLDQMSSKPVNKLVIFPYILNISRNSFYCPPLSRVFLFLKKSLQKSKNCLSSTRVKARRPTLIGVWLIRLALKTTTSFR